MSHRTPRCRRGSSTRPRTRRPAAAPPLATRSRRRPGRRGLLPRRRDREVRGRASAARRSAGSPPERARSPSRSGLWPGATPWTARSGAAGQRGLARAARPACPSALRRRRRPGLRRSPASRRTADDWCRRTSPRSARSAPRTVPWRTCWRSRSPPPTRTRTPLRRAGCARARRRGSHRASPRAASRSGLGAGARGRRTTPRGRRPS